MTNRFHQFISVVLVAMMLFMAGCGILPENFATVNTEPVAADGSNITVAEIGGPLVINEVVTSNKLSLVDEAAGTPDWVELYNSSSEPISLKGYGLSDNVRKLYKYTFPDMTLPAGGYLVVYFGKNTGIEKTDVECTGFGLAKAGDTLFLSDSYYNVLYKLDIPALLTDISFARRDDGTYGYCTAPTPWAKNTTEIGNVQEQIVEETAIDATALQITEVSPKSNGDPWVEIQNISNQDVNLTDYCLSDSANNLTRFTLPEGILRAGEYLIIWFETNKTDTTENAEDSRVVADFKLGSSDTQLWLSTAKGELVSTLAWEADMPTGIVAVRGEGDIARYTTEATPGAQNSALLFENGVFVPMDSTDPIRINEVLRKNRYSIIDSYGSRGKWVELYNTTDQTVSLSGYYLSDEPDNPFKWALPDTSIGGYGYLVIFLSGKESTETELHAPFSLGSDEPSLVLTRVEGLRQDIMEVPTGLGDDVSVGRADDGSLRYYTKPTPGYANAHGFDSADSLGCFSSNSVFISEVCAVNPIRSGLNDWIELYNGSSHTVDLTGWYLSDNPANPTKYTIPGGKIEPGEHFVIEATSHSSRQKIGVATFGLSSSGNTIVLSDREGTLVDLFETGALSLGITSGRMESDPEGKRVFFKISTQGKTNSQSNVEGYTAQPVFSETGLYQKKQCYVAVSCSTPGAKIYYTTDGSKPTTGSKLYTEPFVFKKNTVLRAVAVSDGRLDSPITSFTYLFEEPHTLPVVCVNGDPQNIKEVFAAKNNKTKVEREAYIQYYEDGRLGTEFPCGIKAKGAGTIVYAQKSLAIHLRAGYGQSSVTYPFFGYGDVKTFSSLVLRNSGQDFGDHSTDARVRDSFASRAAVGMHLDYAMTRPVIMYLNGSYYGIYDFNEDLNKDYLVAHYGVDGDAVDIIKRNTTVLKGSNTDIKRVFAYAIEQDLSKDAKYEEFTQWVDVEYFTDYFIAQTYFSNSDMFNQKYWRSQDYKVKWRPIYYDLDFCGANTVKRNIMAQYFNEDGVPSHDGSLTHMNIYIGLKKNAGWRAYAAERYVECICTFYNPERLLGILDELIAEMKPEMSRHISKWGRPKSMSTWNSAVDNLRNFIKKRPSYALKEVKEYFKISQSQMDEWVAKYTPSK